VYLLQVLAWSTPVWTHLHQKIGQIEAFLSHALIPLCLIFLGGNLGCLGHEGTSETQTRVTRFRGWCDYRYTNAPDDGWELILLGYVRACHGSTRSTVRLLASLSIPYVQLQGPGFPS
jgi:hypothetical protein